MKAILRRMAFLAAFLAGGAIAMAADAPKREPGVIDLGTLTVEGKVSKPMVFYVLGRSEFQYKGLKLSRSFVDRIVTSARKNPF